MTKTREAQIIAALEAKESKQPCTRCKFTKLEVLGESDLTVEGSGEGLMSLYKRSVPTVVVACARCGHVWQHALESLGLRRS